MLLVAVAVTETVALTVELLAGAVMETTGAATALFTVTESGALVVLAPAVSFATAVSVCAALELSVVSHE